MPHTHNSLRKVRVVLFWVNLPPDLLRAYSIALFGENVHILYAAEMAQDSRFLLSLEGIQSLKNSSIVFEY
jgi:hypothetical protein